MNKVIIYLHGMALSWSSRESDYLPEFFNTKREVFPLLVKLDQFATNESDDLKTSI